MGIFKFLSKSNSYVPSSYFLEHLFKDKYFYRLMPFSKLDGDHIVAYDPYAPRVITFDPWPEQIFINATGSITVHQFLDTTAKMYGSRVPELLDKVIIDEVERMVERNYIALSDEPVELDPQLLFPRK